MWLGSPAQLEGEVLRLTVLSLLVLRRCTSPIRYSEKDLRRIGIRIGICIDINSVVTCRSLVRLDPCWIAPTDEPTLSGPQATAS